MYANIGYISTSIVMYRLRLIPDQPVADVS